MNTLAPGDVPIPHYQNTDREVAVGDRGACTVPNGQPGTIIGLLPSFEGVTSGCIKGWQVTIRWPNRHIDYVAAGELYWVEPTTTVEVELTDEMIKWLTMSPAEFEDWMVTLDAGPQLIQLLESVVGAVKNR